MSVRGGRSVAGTVAQVSGVCFTYFLQIPAEGGSDGDDSHPEGATSVKREKKEGKVVTIVQRLFHQSASVITCQKKRKESPPNDPERLQTADPSRLVL